MRKKKGNLLLVAFMTMVMGITSGCGAKQDAETTEKETERPTVIVGCDDYTPFSYMDLDGNLTGIDVELATEAFDRMGYQVEIE